MRDSPPGRVVRVPGGCRARRLDRQRGIRSSHVAAGRSRRFVDRCRSPVTVLTQHLVLVVVRSALQTQAVAEGRLHHCSYTTVKGNIFLVGSPLVPIRRWFRRLVPMCILSRLAAAQVAGTGFLPQAACAVVVETNGASSHPRLTPQPITAVSVRAPPCGSKGAQPCEFALYGRWTPVDRTWTNDGRHT